MYKERIIDTKIKTFLETPVALAIVGPKWCGKSTTAKHFSNSFINLQDEEHQNRYKLIAENSSILLLEGEKPRLIAE